MNLLKNIKLQTKIQAIIISMTVIASLIILIVVFSLYKTVILKRIKQDAIMGTKNSALALNNTLNSVTEGFIYISATREFSSFIYDIEQNPDDIITHTINAQNMMRQFSNSHYLVDNCIIIPKSNLFVYSLYQTSAPKNFSSVFSNEELKKINGITIFPERKLKNSSLNVQIPVVFPITLYSRDSNSIPYSIISNDNDKTIVYVVFLLNRDKLIDVLKYNTSTIGEFFISSNITGIILESEKSSSTPAKSPLYTFENTFTFSNSNITFGQNILKPGIFDLLGPGEYIIVLTLAILVFLLPILSIFISKQVVTPIKRLIEAVEQIENGNYKKQLVPKSLDEIGILIGAINKMHSTIESQIIQIKEDEKQRYSTELKLLSSQINPHFLYNTLDEIQFEVKRNEVCTASDMIQYLADYLRIGLSFGADTITISNEIKHAFSYICIMSQRFRKPIIFTPKCSMELQSRHIVKTVLQPLIENSIRHGFGIDANGIPVLSPTVEVNFELQSNSNLLIEISDNGCGFKVNDLLMQMTSNTYKEHIGINNVYKRFVAFYGSDNIEVSASSIPYYRNTISISIKNFPT